MDAREYTDLTARERVVIGEFIDQRDKFAAEQAELADAIGRWETDGDAAGLLLSKFIEEAKLLRRLMNRAVAALSAAERRRKRQRG